MMAKAAGNSNSPHLRSSSWLGARVPPESESVARVQRSPRNARDPVVSGDVARRAGTAEPRDNQSEAGRPMGSRSHP
jgi:hypothetical protein